jgi:hypothetical protein
MERSVHVRGSQQMQVNQQQQQILLAGSLLLAPAAAALQFSKWHCCLRSLQQEHVLHQSAADAYQCGQDQAKDIAPIPCPGYAAALRLLSHTAGHWCDTTAPGSAFCFKTDVVTGSASGMRGYARVIQIAHLGLSVSAATAAENSSVRQMVRQVSIRNEVVPMADQQT